MTQKERILELMSDHEWHDARELNRICFRYGARLWELINDEGYPIEKSHKKGTLWQWRLKEGK